MAGLEAARADVERRGARVLVIGNSAPETIPGFRSVTGYGGQLLVDPSLATYRAAGLVRSLGSVVHPRALAGLLGTMARGFLPGTMRGDTLQQGGTFVLGPGPRVRYEWRDRRSGDEAPLAEVLAVLPPAAA